MRRAPSPLIPIFRSNSLVWLLQAIFAGAPALTLTQLAARAGVSPSTAQREVDLLEGAGIVRSERVGTARLIHVDESSPLVPDLRSLIGKALGVPDVVRAEFASIDGIEEAFIFGSWANRYDGDRGPKPRDVDVLIVGEPDFFAVQDAADRAAARLQIPIDPTVVSSADWTEGRTGLVRTVKGRPLTRILGEATDNGYRPEGHRARRLVIPRDDRWSVVLEGGRRASAVEATQAKAVARAREIVANAGGGEVVVYGRDGRVRKRIRVPSAHPA